MPTTTAVARAPTTLRGEEPPTEATKGGGRPARELWELMGLFCDLGQALPDGVKLFGARTARQAAQRLYGIAFTPKEIRAQLERIATGNAKSTDLEEIARCFERIADQLDRKILDLGSHHSALQQGGATRGAQILKNIVLENTRSSSIGQDIYALVAYRMPGTRDKKDERVKLRDVRIRLRRVGRLLNQLNGSVYGTAEKTAKPPRTTNKKKGKSEKRNRSAVASRPVVVQRNKKKRNLRNWP